MTNSTAESDNSIESIYNNMSEQDRQQFIQYHSYENFKLLHQSQLQALKIPTTLYEQVYKKCYDIETALSELEQLLSVQLVEETVDTVTDDVKTDDTHTAESIENQYYQTVVLADVQPLSDIYVLPHVWNTTEEQLLPQLKTLDGLLDRLWQQTNIQYYLQHKLHCTENQINALTIEQKCHILLKYMFEHRYIQQYLTTISKAKNQRVSELKPSDVVHNYYVDNEYGTSAQQTTDNNKINAKLENFVCITQDGIAVSLLWFTKPIAADEPVVIAQKPLIPCPIKLNTDILTVSDDTEIDDAQVVATTANVTLEQAKEALQKYGNVTDAIVELSSQPGSTQ